METFAIIVWGSIGYIVGTTIVGILAARFNRSVGGWILLSIVISPVIAGAILLALGPRNTGFRSDGSLAGIPYRWQPDWSIDAMMPGGIVRFRTLDHFITAVPNAGDAGDALRQIVQRALRKRKEQKREQSHFAFYAVVAIVIVLGTLAIAFIR